MTCVNLCLGCVAFGGYDYGHIDEKDCIDTIHCALDNNITHFDTADIYGLGRSEELLGAALTGIDKVTITTKFGVHFDKHTKSTYKDISPETIRPALEKSLKRLKRETIDQYLIHYNDGKTNVEDVVIVLDKLQVEGKIKKYGCSNFDANLIKQFANKFSVIQMPYNMLQRDTEPILKFCSHRNYETMAYNILGRGLFTGKYDFNTVEFYGTDTRKNSLFFDKQNEKIKQGLETMRNMANQKNIRLSSLAIAYVAHKFFITCLVVGAKNTKQVIENTKYLNVKLSDEEFCTLDNAFYSQHST